MSRPPLHWSHPSHTRYDDSLPAEEDRPPSKSQLKREMTGLQELGERLSELPPAKLNGLGLPEELVTAINDYRRFNKWEAKRRQMQYIGRLMRDIDATQVVAQLERWSQGTRESVAEFHSTEKWRDRLLSEPDALAALVAEHPGADRAKLAGLIGRAHVEREKGKPPTSSRALFREVAKILGGQ